MTLSTDVYIHDPVDPMDVFRFCQGLLAKYDERGRPADAQRWTQKQDQSYENGEWSVRPGNPWSLDNEPMQDLPAWLMLAYRPDVPLRTPEQAAEHDEDCDEDCDGTGYSHRPACYLSLDFDTAYGYQSKGMGCGDLHALLVAELGEWLTARGVRWAWKNEFSGEVHEGPSRLGDLITGGAEASAWYRDSVLPAILSGALAGES